MKYFVPVHQFEIRFTKLLNFAQVAQFVAAPYVPLCKDITIENEYTRNAKYTLLFDNYFIYLQNDRIFFRFEGDTDALLESGSIVQNPFFSMFKRLQESETFGEVKEMFLYSIFVNPTESAQESINSEKENLLIKNIADKYLKRANTDVLINNLSDVAIVLEEQISSKQIIMTFGPFIGVSDINKRGVLLATNEMLEKVKCIGNMCELKILDSDKENANFGRYKALSLLTEDYIKKLWPSN